MLNRNKKIIVYLAFAKTKLNPNCEAHKGAINEINQILKELKEEEKTNENNAKTKNNKLHTRKRNLERYRRVWKNISGKQFRKHKELAQNNKNEKPVHRKAL